MMAEYRLTRPHLYYADCPGRTNPSARQGHYVLAQDAPTAGNSLRETYPGERFDAQYWGPNVYEGGELVLEHGAYLGVV